MLEILSNRNYSYLFTAQVVALLGTGLLTIGLGIAAYNLAGENAGTVLATALTIKMIVYIFISPFAVAVTGNMNRKLVLISADTVRAAVALCLPFISTVWQIYILIFILQAASATFTPTFQAVIPDILPVEKDYTKALSLSRLAYDLENIASPVIAGLLLSLISYHWLFAGTALGFIFSLVFVAIASVPTVTQLEGQAFTKRLTAGARLYLSTPCLRGLLSLNIAAAAIGAMVIVNTVVIVKSIFSGSESDVALALGLFGLGSMLSALFLPNILDIFTDRSIMISNALMATVILLAYGAFTLAAGWNSWFVLLGVWFLSGIAYSAILTPAGRLLRRSSSESDRPALFAAQFSLSHLCWLGTYPLAGYSGKAIGMEMTMLVLGLLALLALIAGFLLWPDNSRLHSSGEHTGKIAV